MLVFIVCCSGWIGVKRFRLHFILGKNKKTETFICRVGRKVEVSLEEEILRDVWFLQLSLTIRATIVGIDYLHIRLSAPQFTVTSFGLLEKVDAFYDFGWWSGVVTKKLADSRYVVYFKHTNKVKD
ncbi:hypothetical protein Hanom_Chr10g00889781 [Helianthus anomalus]